MNWTRIILDGIAMAAVFNAVVGMSWFLMPHAFAHILPREIKAAAEPFTGEELKKLALVIYPLYICMIAWMVLRQHRTMPNTRPAGQNSASLPRKLLK